jgi:hypothetical protein
MNPTHTALSELATPRSRAGLAGLRLSRRSLWQIGLFGLLPLVFAFAMVLTPMRVELLFNDPSNSASLPPYVGAFSHLGVIAWWGAGTGCLLAAAVLRDGPARWMMAMAGGLSLVLALDDLFQFHEKIGPHHGVPELVTLAAYAAAAIAYLLGFARLHLQLDWPLLLASLVLLGASVAVDVLFAYSIPSLVIEEGTKFAGIVAWSAYHLLAARHWLRRALGTDGAPQG